VCNTIRLDSRPTNAAASDAVTSVAPQSVRTPGFWLAAAGVILLSGAFALVVAPRLRIETNLLALLPATDENRVQLDAVKRFADRSSRELVLARPLSMRTCPVRISFCRCPNVTCGKCTPNQRSSRMPSSS